MGVAQLAVFIRPPTPGETKTRLAGALGEEGAARLYSAFVDDTLRTCSRIATMGNVDLSLWYAGPLDPTILGWAERVHASIHEQPGGDLGVRLSAALGSALSTHERVVVIGSDAPTLPASHIVCAFDALANASLVLGPTSDGGYYAIGASGRPPVLDGVRWSSGSTLEDTRRANPDARIARTPPWYDVDDPHDLRMLRTHLAMKPAAAPATAETLRACLSEVGL